jgi:tRNA(fMet)-specific endonuclease VapC
MANLVRVNVADCAVTIITVAEQMQGRLAVIRRARKEADAVRGFERLRETLAFYLAVQVLPYDAPAVAEFERLRRQRIRIGTQDLRIASIVLSRDATLALPLNVNEKPHNWKLLVCVVNNFMSETSLLWAI